MREAAEYYDFKYEGIPLVHQIMNNYASCKTKLNQFSQALSLLDSTKMWQKGCEGSRSPSLLVTENLIRSVHESRGEKSLIKESDVEIAKIKQSVSYADLVFLKNSKPVIPNNLDQSQININTSMNVESPNIQQSAVNINL